MARFALSLALTAGVLFPAFSGSDLADGQVPVPSPVPAADVPPVPAGPSVVRTVFRHPRRVLRLDSRFTPWAEPSPAQVRRIVDVEAARWGVSAAGLDRRIACESSFEWDNEYASHVGLLQFLGSTWARAVAGMPRRVRYVTRRVRVRWVVRLRYMSDGHVRRSRRWRVQQRVVHVFHGRIPARPPITHGWAQVRAGARAMAGVGGVSSSEWECGT